MEENKQKELIVLLKEWFELKKEITKIEAVTFLSTEKACIEEAGNQLMDYFKETGKKYGQDIDEATQIAKTKDEDIGRIIEDYKKQINVIIEIYRTKHQSILMEKAELEARLAESDERLAEIKIREDGNKCRSDEEKKSFEEEKNKEHIIREVIERAIKECEERIQQNNEDMKNEVDIKNTLKDEEFHNLNEAYLVVMKDTSILQRAVFWFRNKINGSKRFADEIISPLKRGIINLKEKKIPKIKKKVEDVSIKKTAKEYIWDKPKEMIKSTYNSIIEFYQSQKGRVIRSIENSIEKNKEELKIKKKQQDDRKNKKVVHELV